MLRLVLSIFQAYLVCDFICVREEELEFGVCLFVAVKWLRLI